MTQNDNESTQPVEIPSDGTQPVEKIDNTQPGKPVGGNGKMDEKKEAPQGRRRIGLIVLAGILAVLLFGATGGYLGYQAAAEAKNRAYRESITQEATEQFMLALQAQKDKHYVLAQRHIEYVIKLDPEFPGARDKLAEILLEMARQDTPTPVPPTPTITPSPTPDLRGEEEIFNNAWNLLGNKDWEQALQVLGALRDRNLAYKAVQVDGMYYVALRHRGLQQISTGQLEEGLYSLALVEKFGPLDVDANGVRTWARLYISGSRYWGVRWDKVVTAFAEIYPAYPSLHDSSGVTATERYRIASIRYAEQLLSENKPCEAQQQYQNAASIATDDTLNAALADAINKCTPPTEVPPPTAVLSPTPTVGVPTVETPLPPADTPVPPAETPTAEVPQEPAPTAEPPPAAP